MFMLCVFVDMFICIPSFARCRAGPDAGFLSDVGQGPMSDIVRCRAGPDEAGGAHDMLLCDYVIMCMVCGSLGRLTKLRAYSFQFWFQVLSVEKGRARDDRTASHYVFHTQDLCELYSDVVLS